jgi:glucan phosphoethanolaminetransferase (alkaline phosphatase superfamily)
MPENIKVLSEQFWMSSVVIAIVDVVFVLLLIWRIKPSRFRELKWTLVGTAAMFWSIFGVVLVLIFWDSYYHYFFPSWFRSGGILLYVPILYGAFALAFYWLALRMPGNPIVIFGSSGISVVSPTGGGSSSG